jgi:rsbT co-antagonist protein RsbR
MSLPPPALDQEVPDAEASEKSSELFASLDMLCTVLRAVAAGQSPKFLEITYPDSHPVGALTLSVNTMMESLYETRKQSDEYSRDLADKVRTIEQQQAAIQELSTPIIEVWPGVLCAPVIGALDGARATDVNRTLLATIVAKKTPLVIIDITGIEAMDTRAADNFVRMARSVRLLGAKCVLSGVHPNIARSIVELGVDLSGIESYRSIREALQRYVRATVQNGRVPKSSKGSDQ